MALGVVVLNITQKCLWWLCCKLHDPYTAWQYVWHMAGMCPPPAGHMAGMWVCNEDMYQQKEIWTCRLLEH